MVEHRVDDERIYGYVLAGVHDFLKGIEEKESSQPLPMKLLVDGEPAQNAGWDWVLGKLSDKV